jgi:O-antigen/teichoic acid export membrane protein
VVSLVAALGLLTLPFGGAQYAVARFIGVEAARGHADAVGSIVRRVMLGALLVAGSITVVVTGISPLVRHGLGVEKLTPVVLAALFMLPALLAPAMLGVAQGMQRFGLISASLVAGAVSRILLLLLLIPLGLGVGGVMGATLVAGFVSLTIPLRFVLRWFRTPHGTRRGPKNTEIVRYLVPVVGGTLAITSLTTLDLIAAKISLTPRDAGIYGSASFIGRLLLYLPTTVATVLLPKVTSRAAVSRDTKEILHASIAVTAIFSLCGVALLVLIPHFVVDVTFGAKYSAAVPLIGLFGLAMTLYSLLNVQLAYHLGHGRQGMAWLLLVGAVFQVVAFVFIHGSTYQLVGVSLGTAVAILTVHELFFERTLWPSVSWFFGYGRRRLRRRSGR